MKTFAEIQALFTEELNKLDWSREPVGLYEPIGYILALGGKCIRPALVLLANDMFNGNLKEAMPAALALEVFHNFTLLHDDIMDKAPIRRGRPTVHVKWNDNTAILSGDTMLIEAYKLLAQVPGRHLKATLDIFSKTACEICEGQQYDMEFETRQNVSVPEYMEMIRLKTAVLLGMALQVGADLADAPQADVEELYQFGINIGLAFQLKDDYLDVYGDEKTFGKAIGGDILCNKKTYMLISALNAADGATKRELERWLADSTDNAAKISAVTGIYNTLRINEKCEDAMNIYFQKAVANLDKINIIEAKKHELRTLAERLMLRNE